MVINRDAMKKSEKARFTEMLTFNNQIDGEIVLNNLIFRESQNTNARTRLTEQ